MNKKVLSITLLIVLVGILAVAATACSAADQAQIGDGNRFGQVEVAEPLTVQTQNEVSTARGFGSAYQDIAYSGQMAASTAVAGSVRGQSRGSTGIGGSGSGGYGGAGTGLATTGTLSEVEAEALVRAIEEEYGAQALYESVLATFGEVEPFASIAQSEAQHAAALIRLADKYGVEVPEYPGVDGLPIFDSLEAACQAGEAAEIADAALYDELMALTDKADLLRVFTNLQRASLEKHLPAFQVCE